MLSDEEKKAIEGLFHLAHINTYLDLEKEKVVKISRHLIDQWRDKTEILLNLVEKQSKEIEELKEVKWYYEISRVPKDKIKAKIEEYDDKGMTVNLANRSAGKTFQQAVHYEVKKVLQSLLEKE